MDEDQTQATPVDEGTEEATVPAVPAEGETEGVAAPVEETEAAPAEGVEEDDDEDEVEGGEEAAV